MKNLLASLALVALLAGCGGLPLRPGSASFVSHSGAAGEVHQSQNPQQETTQNYKKVVEPGPDGKQVRIIETIDTKIGAAQKDTAREVAAKLSAMKGIVWVGLLVFLFGATSFVYPPVKLLVGGSVTTSAVITGAGLALIVLPSLIVGHELEILGVALGAAALYWFSHRHGKLQGFVDANKDGIDDRL